MRSLAAAAGVSLLGMAIMGLSGPLGLGSFGVTVGVALAGIGIGLVILTQEAARKSSVDAMLTDDGFMLASSRTRFGLTWADVKRVSMAGNELIIRDSKGHEVKVVAPPGSKPEELDALAAAMAAALDANRGYGSSLTR